MKYIVGVDEGTTSCKCCVFDESGNLKSSATREYSSYYPKPGYVEQNLDEIIQAVYDSCKQAILTSGIDRESIVGVSFSNQGAMLLLDKDGNSALKRAIGWQDMRYNEVMVEARERLNSVMTADEYFDLAGMTYGFYNIPQIDWVKKNDPDGWQRVACCGGHQTFLLKKFGADDFYIDESEAAVLGMMNVETREWDERLIATYGIEKGMLPKIVHTPGEVVGYVTEKVAGLTGLPIGCKIGIGGHDVNCSKMGCGAKEGGTETLIVGTAGVSLLICDEDIKDPNRRITFRTNPGFDNYQQYILTYTAASSFRWFRDELCTFEVAAGRLMNTDPYDIMTAIARNSKPGANGRKTRSFYKNAAIVAAHLIPTVMSDDKGILLKMDKMCQERDFDLTSVGGNVFGNWGLKEIMPSKVMGTPKEYMFEKQVILGADDYESYLTNLYGNWRELPPIEKRVTHHDYLELNLYKSYIK